MLGELMRFGCLPRTNNGYDLWMTSSGFHVSSMASYESYDFLMTSNEWYVFSDEKHHTVFLPVELAFLLVFFHYRALALYFADDSDIY